MLDGEIDPESASVSVSKSAWRKQKGDMSKKDTEVRTPSPTTTTTLPRVCFFRD